MILKKKSLKKTKLLFNFHQVNAIHCHIKTMLKVMNVEL